MKTLYIVRHAKSNWDNPELEDFERPLSRRGKREAPEVAGKLRDAGASVDLMISSSALRAVTTARVFADELAYPLKLMYITNSLYEASYRDYYEALSSVPDDVDSVMVFGHNPTCTDVVHRLTTMDIQEMSTSCAAHIVFNDATTWAEAIKSVGELKELISAK